jgi:hypothetical protein
LTRDTVKNFMIASASLQKFVKNFEFSHFRVEFALITCYPKVRVNYLVVNTVINVHVRYQKYRSSGICPGDCKVGPKRV